MRAIPEGIGTPRGKGRGHSGEECPKGYLGRIASGVSMSKKNALKKFLKIGQGRNFTRLAKSYGVPASSHGVKFNEIKRNLAIKICSKEGIQFDGDHDALLRARLGKTKEAFDEMAKKAKQKAPPPAPKMAALQKIGKPHPDYVRDDGFYQSREWLELRYIALKTHGARCQCCGKTAADGVTIHVDHIHPRYTHPHLSLSIENLQILCSQCNFGKGAWDSTDWRGANERPAPEKATKKEYESIENEIRSHAKLMDSGETRYEFAMRMKTPAGGWTKATLGAIGIAWPATKGWLTRLKIEHFYLRSIDTNGDWRDHFKSI